MANDTEKYFNVYKVEEKIEFPDPDMPQPRYHTSIFVQPHGAASGTTHHVTGDLVTGMKYETKSSPPAEQSASFHAKHFLGKIKESHFPVLTQICRDQPPPGRQKRYNMKTNRTEPVKADGGFYEEGEERERLVKCTEWTVERVIPALMAAGILE